MGKVAQGIDIVAELAKDNPKMRHADLTVYADALRIYLEAAANVQEFGAIVSHPRTGAPIDNPYLKVQTTTGNTLAKMRGVKSDRVLALLKSRAAIA